MRRSRKMNQKLKSENSYYSDKLGIKLYTGAATIIVSASVAITLMCSGVLSDFSAFTDDNLKQTKTQLEASYGTQNIDALDIIDDNQTLLDDFKRHIR